MSSSELKEIDAAGSILFLGAGFSRDATNIQGRHLPTGSELRDELARMLHVSSSDYNLETLVDEVNSQKDLNLYQTLYELYTVTKLRNHQVDILGLPWRRLYTTNFDNAVESHALINGSNLHTYTYEDDKPKRLTRSVIHLHGSIHSTTEDNVLNQLVLSERSYVHQHFEKSPWYDEFVRDIRFCNACFFVGYSLSDHHISALLLQDPSFRERIFFVTEKEIDSIFANRIRPYGKILPIGIEGFAQLCRTLPKPASLGDLHALKAFRYVDPHKDKKTLLQPTPLEILNLVTYGIFNYQRCLSTLPGAQYIVPRQELAEQATKELSNARCLLVHSHLGNGKSIFLHVLAHKLSEHGYRCFWCRSNPLIQQRELDYLKTVGKIAILFDSYSTAIDLMDRLSESLPETKFVVAIRTAIQDVRLHEIQERLPTPVRRINLNGIKDKDIYDFKKLLDQSGVRVPMLEEVIDQCNDFREVVTSLYNNEEIREKIRDELQPIFQDENSRNVFIVSHLLKWVGHDVDPAFLRSVTGADAYVEIAKYQNISRDIFRLDDDDIQVRSAIFSEYLILNHLKTDDIINCVYGIITQAVRRKEDRNYRAILSSLMRFSILHRALKGDSDRLTSLNELFDRLHRDNEVNQEPLFWLQYSILMTASDNLRAAESFIRTAYSRATERPGFRTFQIDTYALKLLLRIEGIAQDSPKVERFEEIIEKLDKVRSMIWDESRRFHAVQVIEDIEPFVVSRVSVLSVEEREALVQHLGMMRDTLDGLPESVRVATGSGTIRNSVNRARERILRESRTS